MINFYKIILAEKVEAKQDSGALLKEFFELTDFEETFLERKASIRRSLRSRKKNQTEDFPIETQHFTYRDIDGLVAYV